MGRYIGLDVHKTSCMMVVLGDSGRLLQKHVLPMSAKPLIDQIKLVERPRRLCLEEGTQSAYLYAVLSPYVDDLVVTTKTDRRGNKDDERDAIDLAQKLRTDSLPTRVYKDVGPYGRLRELVRVHAMQVNDSARVSDGHNPRESGGKRGT